MRATTTYFTPPLSQQLSRRISGRKHAAQHQRHSCSASERHPRETKRREPQTFGSHRNKQFDRDKMHTRDSERQPAPRQLDQCCSSVSQRERLLIYCSHCHTARGVLKCLSGLQIAPWRGESLDSNAEPLCVQSGRDESNVPVDG